MEVLFLLGTKTWFIETISLYKILHFKLNCQRISKKIHTNCIYTMLHCNDCSFYIDISFTSINL